MSPQPQDPVYQRLIDQLRSLLREEAYRPGQKFLSEREICRKYQVSRATANKALSNLMAEGVLEYRRGIGTFIRGEVLNYDLRSLVSFTEKALAAGRKPATRVLHFGHIQASQAPEAARELNADQDSQLIHMQRLRLADNQPVILESRWCPARLCPNLTREDLDSSIYALWTDRYELDIAGADQILRAVNLDAAQAAALDVPKGRAALLSVSTGRLSDGRGLWHEHTLYRADAYEFHNRLGELRTLAPAVGMLCPPPASTPTPEGIS